MKKTMLKSITFLFPVLFLLSCSGEKIKNDLINTNLRGKVKKISESVYSGVEKFGEIEKDGLKSKTTYNYDNKGFRDCSDNLTIDGHTFKYEYDEKGNQIEYNEFNTDGSLSLKTKVLFDKNDSKVESNCYRSDGRIVQKDNYQYDAKGNLSEKKTYVFSEDGTYEQDFCAVTKYKYDKNGNIIEEIIDLGNRNPPHTWTNTYDYIKVDKAGNWVKRIKYYKGVIESITEREIEYY